MKIKPVHYIYFLLIAPILAKAIEWILQFATGAMTLEVLKTVWWLQLIFILCMSGALFLIAFIWRDKATVYQLSFVPAAAYFLKEVYNHFIYAQTYSTVAGIVALTLEPVFIWAILGYLPYKIFFGGKN